MVFDTIVLERRRRGSGVLRSDAGAAFVELAIALPVLVVLVVGTADFARAFYYAIELTNAARAGAQYGSYNSAQSTETALIKTAAQNAAANIGLTAGDINVATACMCAADDPLTTTPLLQAPPTTPACSSTCTAGVRHMQETVTVTATKAFTTISRFPGIPNSLTLTRTATMRVAL
jgi:Flp pilus assembly protein TadG